MGAARLSNKVKVWNKKHPKWYKTQKAAFAQGDEISFCLPCTARNCTVLGYNVTPTHRSWRALDWDREVMIDGIVADEQYLHVFANLDGHDPNNPDDWARYRVRSRLEVGEEITIEDGGPAVIKSVEVAGMWDDKWWWRYTAKKRGA